MSEKHRADAKLGVQTRVVQLYPPPNMLPCGRPSRTSMAPFVTKNCPASPWWLKSWNRLKTTLFMLRTCVMSPAWKIHPSVYFPAHQARQDHHQPMRNSFDCAIGASASHAKCFARRSTRLGLGSQNRCLDGFRKLSDHILGERIAGMKGPARMEPCAAI